MHSVSLFPCSFFLACYLWCRHNHHAFTCICTHRNFRRKNYNFESVLPCCSFSSSVPPPIQLRWCPSEHWDYRCSPPRNPLPGRQCQRISTYIHTYIYIYIYIYMYIYYDIYIYIYNGWKIGAYSAHIKNKIGSDPIRMKDSCQEECSWIYKNFPQCSIWRFATRRGKNMNTCTSIFARVSGSLFAAAASPSFE